ncbi:hypothetical protein ACNFJN_12015 [Xenorhabdus budapestensis]|uniref:hypothetical protein n=1 Tax=Xenorhabdus budapestensis TaxID=290110 RepID=UPI003A843680
MSNVSHFRINMSKELRNNIITAIVTASLTAASFIGKDWYDEKNRKNQFVEELYKQLYNKGAAELERLDTSYSDLQSMLSKGYALTTYELDPAYTKFQEAIESYQRYIKELERFGNSGQVQVAKNLSEWVIGLYAEFNLQYETAEQVQKRARELLLVENPNSDLFKFVNEALEHELERLVQNENRVYYEADRNKKPIIRGLEQYFNYQFRSALGLDATTDMAKAINELPELVKRKLDSEYKDQQLPFIFAEGRVFQAPTLEFSGKNDFFKQKNDVLKEQAKMKFLSLVIKNDKQLQDILKKRKISELRK